MSIDHMDSTKWSIIGLFYRGTIQWILLKIEKKVIGSLYHIYSSITLLNYNSDIFKE